MPFTNKVCIVTGATSGIGRATAECLAQQGGKLLLIDKDEEGGRELVSTLRDQGTEVQFAPIDLADAAAIETAVGQALARWGRIDVLINNAAMMSFKPIVDLSVEEWDQVQAVNLRAVFLFCKYCIPHMQGGAIVNVSSVHAHQSTANVIPYASSKGGLEAFTRGVATEYPMDQVRINCVAPGAVDTPMLWENPNVKSGQEKVEGVIGQPTDIAAAICFLASDEARFINGTTLVADGGRLAVL
ncbi:SDR family NAD(P)-dependent oxidoreductase [Spirosoma sp.]|uniref:SDR family NAD(P)-dependent oxidoreductase n=1 Tax=Spirosoma sp. TaxID=1899569 RepID=UPI003B3B502D